MQHHCNGIFRSYGPGLGIIRDRVLHNIQFSPFVLHFYIHFCIVKILQGDVIWLIYKHKNQ